MSNAFNEKQLFDMYPEGVLPSGYCFKHIFM